MKKEIIDTNSLAHTKWNCKYHIVFAPKYRRKVFFEEKRLEIREILRKLLKLEVSVGAYKCKNCGHEIVPTYSEALRAMHRGTTRYLKCPKCEKRTWCKKVLKK